MEKKIELAVRIGKEQLSTNEEVYVATCDELDIADQGATIEEAKQNLLESIKLWISAASETEVDSRLPILRRQNSQIYNTR